VPNTPSPKVTPRPAPTPAQANPSVEGKDPSIVFDETPVASTNVDTIGPYKSDGSLQVTFLSGAIYMYYDVPPEIARAFLAAQSPGQFVNYVMSAFAYEEIE
jgi:hypothetical protein